MPGRVVGSGRCEIRQPTPLTFAVLWRATASQRPLDRRAAGVSQFFGLRISERDQDKVIRHLLESAVKADAGRPTWMKASASAVSVPPGPPRLHLLVRGKSFVCEPGRTDSVSP